MADDFIVRLEFDVRDARQAGLAMIDVIQRLKGQFGGMDNDLRAAERSMSRFTGEAKQGQQATKGWASAWSPAISAQKQFENQNAKMAQGLSTTRYALYDVSQTLAIVGVAMVGLAAATYGAGIAWERDFANVIRTSGLEQGSEQIERLRNDFMDLAGTIPIAASELAEIGTLAGQLGIAADDMVEFTSVVARFAAVSDLSVEQTATAFGRLKALLPDVANGSITIEELASSILKVGVNSVATEGEITKIATQLSSMAGYAGLTADELIGLSAALASVGTQPELARGTVTRLFTQMGKAITGQGKELEKFADLAGVSANEFASAFGTERFGPIFLKFVEGLGDVSEGGGDAVATLRELGITSVRDVPALTRLASAANSAGEAGALLAQTMGDANAGILEGSELNNQYGIIADTVASKLQVLVNNFNNLLVAVGDGGGIFGGLIDGLNDFLRSMTNIAQHPFWGVVVQAIPLILGLVGVLALIGGVTARGYAGLIAITQAMIGMSGAAGAGVVPLSALLGTLRATGPAGVAAAAGIRVLSAALKTLGVIGLALIGIEVMKGIGQGAAEVSRQIKGINTDLDSTLDRLRTPQESNFLDLGDLADNEFLGWLNDVDRGMNDMGFTTTRLTNDIKAADEAFAAMAQAGDLDELQGQLEAIAKANDVGVGDLIERMPTLRDALDEAGIGFRELADGTVQFSQSSKDAAGGVDALADAELVAEERALGLAAALGLTGEELEQLYSDFAKGSAGFTQYGDLIQRVQDQTKGFAEKTSKEVYGSADSWQEFYDGSSVNIHAFMGLLDQQIAAQETWAGDLSELTARGASAFVAELAKMGPEGAPLAKAAVDLTTDELMKLEEQAALAAFLASDAYAQTWAAQNAVLAQVMEQGGIEAVRGMITAQRQEATGKVPGAVAAFVNTWNSQYASRPIQMPVYTNTGPAAAGLNQFIRDYSGRQIPLYVQTIPANGVSGRPVNIGQYASGGHVRGPGSGTSDSIPAYLSNGEYVIRAAAVRKYGTGMFDQLNRGIARFASGGPVSRGSQSVVGTGIMELGPKSLGRLGGSGAPTVNIMLDDVAIARAAARGQKKLGGTGEQL